MVHQDLSFNISTSTSSPINFLGSQVFTGPSSGQSFKMMKVSLEIAPTIGGAGSAACAYQLDVPNTNSGASVARTVLGSTGKPAKISINLPLDEPPRIFAANDTIVQLNYYTSGQTHTGTLRVSGYYVGDTFSNTQSY
jgi:hypothetical protein